MTQFLPPNLLVLFKARDPIKYLPPADKLSWEKKTNGYSGVASLMSKFEVSIFQLRCIYKVVMPGKVDFFV